MATDKLTSTMRSALRNIADGLAPFAGAKDMGMTHGFPAVITSLRKRGYVYVRNNSDLGITDAGKAALAEAEKKVN